VSRPEAAAGGDLSHVARLFGAAPPPEVARAIGRFFELLLLWNQRINLTLSELVDEHLPDSFGLAGLVPAGARVVDVGSGGGLPAVPFALLRPDASLTLVEPRAKRVAFLRTALRELGLTADLLEARAEDLAPGSYDCAASRATFPPDQWLAVGRRLVRPGGRVVVFVNAGPGVVPRELPAPAARVDWLVPGERPRAALAYDVPRGTSVSAP
jgi:16S rRNA (guanine527-N7)-methyltransferase